MADINLTPDVHTENPVITQIKLGDKTYDICDAMDHAITTSELNSLLGNSTEGGN